MAAEADLISFITARLDEDEAVAKAAAQSGNQFANPGMFAGEWRRANRSVVVESDAGAVIFDEGAPSDEQADHIARHDPARVLREVEAKRMLIAAVLRYETIIDGEWGDCHEEDEIAAGLCPEHQPDEMAALRWLATVWSGHPGYRPEWKP